MSLVSSFIFFRFKSLGWGRTETGKPANILQQAVLPVASEQKCRTVNEKLDIKIRPDTMICAGGQGKGKPGGCRVNVDDISLISKHISHFDKQGV